jgi:hypothetical protein
MGKCMSGAVLEITSFSLTALQYSHHSVCGRSFASFLMGAYEAMISMSSGKPLRWRKWRLITVSRQDRVCACEMSSHGLHCVASRVVERALRSASTTDQ